MDIEDMERAGIAPDWGVFARDGETSVGAVRHVRRGRVDVFIEGFGEATLSPEQIDHAGEGKVVLALDRLPEAVSEAIAHAHDAELPDVADRGRDDEPIG